MSAPTWQDLYNLGKAQAQALRPELLVLPGDGSDMLLAGSASMADRVTGFAADEFRKTYIDGAEGDDLTTLCDDHWKVERELPQQATGVLSLARPSFAAGAGTVAAGSTFATTRDALGREVQVTNDIDVSFGASDLGPHTVNATAVVAGKQGNVQTTPNPVSRVVTPLFDPGITVSQVGNFAGGVDDEEDDSLRERTRGFPATLRRGTLDALEYGAKTVTGVATATAQEDAGGIVTVYVADSAGNSSPTMVTNVQNIMIDWRAAGALVYVAGGILDAVDVDLTIGARVGFDVQAAAPLIQASVTAAMGKLKINDPLHRDLLQAAARAVDPQNILSVRVNAPLADPLLPAAIGHVIRAGTINVD